MLTVLNRPTAWNTIFVLFPAKSVCTQHQQFPPLHVSNCWLRNNIYKESVGIYMFYLCTKFHRPSSNGSLVTAIKPKDKYRFQTAAILLCCILQGKQICKSCMFLKYLLPYLIWRNYIQWSQHLSNLTSSWVH
jgi:hypothetical protein